MTRLIVNSFLMYCNCTQQYIFFFLSSQNVALPVVVTAISKIKDMGLSSYMIREKNHQ